MRTTHLALLAAAATCTFAARPNCDDINGECLPKDTKCTKLRGRCTNGFKGFKCCSKDMEEKRICKKSCQKKTGVCVKRNSTECSTVLVPDLCPGFSCDCCVTDKSKCGRTPECANQGGFCVMKNMASTLCPGGQLFDDGCAKRKCTCCLLECECGKINDARVVGGENVDPAHKYPWIVQLINPNGFLCGGSIINSQYILTAAHCVKDDLGNELLVRVAEHDQSSTDDDVPATKDIDVERIIAHPDYNDITFANDIALLRLSEPLDFSARQVGPVCLPAATTDTFMGETMTLTGWGATSEGGAVADILQEAKVPIVECPAVVAGAETNEEINLCGGFPEGGIDTCQGDSGGATTVIRNGTQVQVGIVSFGEGCARPGLPGVYTRVSAYLDWIQDNMRDFIGC